VTHEPMRCPNCDSRLVEVERSEILIDACPECRGIWLDRGELDKILVRERSLSAHDPDEDFFAEVEGRKHPSRSGEAERQQSEDGPRGKRKKRSFFEDLLDFE
jgi:uncharacterized protein